MGEDGRSSQGVETQSPLGKKGSEMGDKNLSWFCKSQESKVQGSFLGKTENKILRAMYNVARM